MKKSDSTGCILAIILLIVSIPLSTLLYSTALMWNWNWFATTLGAPRVSFWQAYGISTVVACFVPYKKSEDSKDNKEPWELLVSAIAAMIVRFGILAGVGWAVHGLL
jgi:hypothetical protein